MLKEKETAGKLDTVTGSMFGLKEVNRLWQEINEAYQVRVFQVWQTNQALFLFNV